MFKSNAYSLDVMSNTHTVVNANCLCLLFFIHILLSKIIIKTTVREM